MKANTSSYGIALLTVILVCGASSVGTTAAAQDASSSCVLNKKTYTCDWGTFRRALDKTASVAIQIDPLDTAAHKQLKELVVALGKTVANGPATMVFVLRPVDETGVSIGPSDTDLATLRVYAVQADGTHRDLLWSEIYRGQADRPWPIVVHSLIQRFQERFR